jgi:hypothetical protein
MGKINFDVWVATDDGQKLVEWKGLLQKPLLLKSCPNGNIINACHWVKNAGRSYNIY